MLGYYVVVNGEFTENSPYRSSIEAQSEAEELNGKVEQYEIDEF